MTKLASLLTPKHRARLFPVLATTSKEGRTTSIFLACLERVPGFAEVVLESLNKRVGRRSTIECFTEVAFNGEEHAKGDRPDGVIVLKNGTQEWKALVEAKVGSNNLEYDQIERYREIAKKHEIDCVITISNQFVTSPEIHPIDAVRKSKSKIPVFHWSWMYLLTQAFLFTDREDINDNDPGKLMIELTQFLGDESSGVKSFDRMPPEWVEVCRIVRSGGKILSKSDEAKAVVTAWHRETRDLALQLSRMTGTFVTEKLSRIHKSDSRRRLADAIDLLSAESKLEVVLNVPNAAEALNVSVNLLSRSIDVSMKLRAPEDKVRTSSRLNWLLSQLKKKDKGEFLKKEKSEVHIRLFWPGRNEPTSYELAKLLDEPRLGSKYREHLAVYEFEVFRTHDLGGMFSQRSKFIDELEKVVPGFYFDIGQRLESWRRPAPRIKEDRAQAKNVAPSALGELAEGE